MLSGLSTACGAVSRRGLRSFAAAAGSESGILVEEDCSTRTVLFNRPKALNALDYEMVQTLTPMMKRWEQNEHVKTIVFKGVGGKAFCAGGDVAQVRAHGMDASTNHLTYGFFGEEYDLNYFLATSKVPVVSIMNGITMGGGVGLAVHGAFRVATNNSLFAMPETAIGLFPDVGGSLFLPRLNYSAENGGEKWLGLYLGLTGLRLKGQDLVAAGIATHYVPTQRLQDMEQRLAEISTRDTTVIDDTILEFVDHRTEHSAFENHAESIERYFGPAASGKEGVEEIYARLETEADSEWAAQTKALMDKMSPTSLKVSTKQLVLGADMTPAECFQMEYRMSKVFCPPPPATHDFYEGVRAVLVDKDQKPVWSPATLAEVSDADVDAYFPAAAEDGEGELKLDLQRQEDCPPWSYTGHKAVRAAVREKAVEW